MSLQWKTYTAIHRPVLISFIDIGPRRGCFTEVWGLNLFEYAIWETRVRLVRPLDVWQLWTLKRHNNGVHRFRESALSRWQFHVRPVLGRAMYVRDPLSDLFSRLYSLSGLILLGECFIRIVRAISQKQVYTGLIARNVRGLVSSG